MDRKAAYQAGFAPLNFGGVMAVNIYNQDCMEFMATLPDNSIDAIVTDPPYGLSFMGKKWDYDVPTVAIWRECLRVLKPGGHLLSFAGTRTQHRMACNIEDAGFEIRDMIAWIYGSGFPKSLSIGKAVDKLQGKEVKTTYVPNHKNDKYGKGMGGGVTDNTPSDNEYNGWGTALKPSVEPLTVARKPLEKGLTVAENCLKWGVGGINIDGCRIGMEKIHISGGGGGKGTGWGKKEEINEERFGRFPANLIHDGSQEVLDLFPNTKSKSGGMSGTDPGMWSGKKQVLRGGHDDFGSAARFFYCAKASKAERNRGCEGLYILKDNTPKEDIDEIKNLLSI